LYYANKDQVTVVPDPSDVKSEKLGLMRIISSNVGWSFKGISLTMDVRRRGRAKWAFASSPGNWD